MASNKGNTEQGVKKHQTPLEYILENSPKEKNDPKKQPGLGVTLMGEWDAGHYAHKVDLARSQAVDTVEKAYKAKKAEIEATAKKGEKVEDVIKDKPNYVKAALLAKAIITLQPEYAPAISPIVAAMVKETMIATEIGEYKPQATYGDVTDPMLVKRFINRAKALLHCEPETIINKGCYFVFGWVDNGED